MLHGQRRSPRLPGSDSLLLTRAKRLGMAIALSAAMALLGGFAPSLQPGGGLQITMSPALYPTFNPNISDYVVNAGAGTSVQVTVNAPANTSVSVDGQPFRTLQFTTPVRHVYTGQSFSFVVKSGTSSKTYYVRRLPSDFPAWTTLRPGTPQAEYYVFAPNLKVDFSNFHHYSIIADNNGVPIWWYRSAVVPVDVKLLRNGRIGVISFGAGQERSLAGALTRNFVPPASLGGAVDNHELLLLPNGNYVYIVDIQRGPVDLSPYGGSNKATVIDNVIEEVTPGGKLVWHWSAMDHIPVAETDPHWWQTYLVNSSPADPYHMNSVEVDGNGYIISCRHLNALIRLDRSSGARTWKLGGTSRPESLKFVGDPFSNFGGQHDARVLAGGLLEEDVDIVADGVTLAPPLLGSNTTLTVHDDGTLLGRAPRAVRYRISTTGGTATMVDQVTDANAPWSGCCGSARKLPEGDWVMEWGQNPNVTELTANGGLVFRMTFLDPYFSYRAYPVPFGTITRSTLRQGMNTQFPR